jgi:hypothetical protein
MADNIPRQDWVERRKKKKIILQDLMAVKPSLVFHDVNENVIDATWRSWKARHRFTSATWDMLITLPKPGYFVKRLRNDAFTRRAKDLEKLHPEALYMFTRFMKLKYQPSDPVGEVQVRGLDIAQKVFVTSSQYKYEPRQVNLAVVDIRESPTATATTVASGIDPFLYLLYAKMEPRMFEPKVWLFILDDKEDLRAATSFVALKLQQYEYAISTYVPSKAEMLNNVTNRGTAPDVPLLFLFKKDNDFGTASRPFMKDMYRTPYTNAYYQDAARNTEAKWRIEPTELRMEFYLDILQAFARPGENVLGLFSGAKFMLAAKVSCILDLVIETLYCIF